MCHSTQNVRSVDLLSGSTIEKGAYTQDRDSQSAFWSDDWQTGSYSESEGSLWEVATSLFTCLCSGEIGNLGTGTHFGDYGVLNSFSSTIRQG